MEQEMREAVDEIRLVIRWIDIAIAAAGGLPRQADAALRLAGEGHDAVVGDMGKATEMAHTCEELASAAVVLVDTSLQLGHVWTQIERLSNQMEKVLMRLEGEGSAA